MAKKTRGKRIRHIPTCDCSEVKLWGHYTSDELLATKEKGRKVVIHLDCGKEANPKYETVD